MPDSAYAIGDAERLDEHGSRVITEIDGIEIAVLNVHGKYYAIPNTCPHVGGPLGEGRLTGHTDVDECEEITYSETETVLTCPWHTRRFDITTGENIDDSRFKIPTFDVQEVDGQIYVSL